MDATEVELAEAQRPDNDKGTQSHNFKWNRIHSLHSFLFSQSCSPSVPLLPCVCLLSFTFPLLLCAFVTLSCFCAFSCSAAGMSSSPGDMIRSATSVEPKMNENEVGDHTAHFFIATFLVLLYTVVIVSTIYIMIEYYK